MPTDTDDPIPLLLDSLGLVDSAIGLVQVGLNSNPSVDKERTLNQQEQRLTAERSVLQAEIDAANDGCQVQGPTTAQHASIVALTVQVESATNTGAAADDVVDLVSQALGLVSQVVST